MKIFTKKNWKSLIDQGEEGLPERLKEALSSCDKLDLHSCSITQSQLKAISEALEHNSSLTSINLGSNNIGDEGAKALAEALKKNSTITTIDLDYNKIKLEGSKALSVCLKYNSSITSINLRRNCIRTEGARVLLEAIKVNRKITSVLFRSLIIHPDIYLNIVEATKENQEFQALCEDIEGNNFSRFDMKTINKFIPLIEESIEKTSSQILRKKYQDILFTLNTLHYHPNFLKFYGIVKEPKLGDEDNPSDLLRLPLEVLSLILNYVGVDVKHIKAPPIVSGAYQSSVDRLKDISTDNSNQHRSM
jgi:Ran GTPase-activating protein (RanGAP) involved in mRNA processing and transport